MRKIFQSTGHRRHYASRAAKEERKRRKRKRRKYWPGQVRHPREYYEAKLEALRRSATQVQAPDCLSMNEHPTETVAFINQVQAVMDRNEHVMIDLRATRRVGNDGVVVMFALLQEFHDRDLCVFGNKPLGHEPRRVLERSGLFQWVHGKIESDANSSKNRIYGSKSRKVLNEEAQEWIDSAAETIWGEKRKCPGVYRVLVEAMANTNEHAHPKKMAEYNWFLHIDHDEENKIVKFSFIDYGVGIFKSINKKIGTVGVIDKVAEVLRDARQRLGSDADLLRFMLKGEKVRTRTQEPFRGKGLRSMYKTQKRGRINNLIIISNKVQARVCQDEFRNLPVNFSGTFIYWELGEDNHNRPWTDSKLV